MIRVDILIGRARVSHQFMIDTGADYTVVQREVVLSLFEAAGVDLEEASGVDEILLNGVGPVPVTCRVQRAGLKFVDIDGGELILANSILVPQAVEDTQNPRQGTERSRVPSLLGRDVLQRFDFHLSYDPPTVSLTLND